MTNEQILSNVLTLCGKGAAVTAGEIEAKEAKIAELAQRVAELEAELKILKGGASGA